MESATKEANQQFERHVLGRLDRLLAVRRFVAGWLVLIVLLGGCTIYQIINLSHFYQTLRPVPGGIYNEGIIGSYSNANPLYATGAVDTAVSHLIFAGLMTYDEHDKLVGALASKYTVDSTGKQYTVTLKPNLTWQDGQPLTAKDVVFTYHLIQNPDANSPLLSSWQGVTVTAVNDLTVKFVLPSALSAFPYGLTNGIVPQHVLTNVPVKQLRSSTFNTTSPVGAGPFAWQGIQINGTDPTTTTTLIALKPFVGFYGGQPKLDSFVIHTYSDSNQLVKAFERRDVMAMSGLTEVPKNIDDKNSYSYNFPLTAAVMTFFKTSSGVLADVNVRRALVQAANTEAIIRGLPFSSQPVHEPLLMNQIGYNPKYQQSAYNVQAAKTTLTNAGWVEGKNGIRAKNGQPLSFHLYAEDTTENQQVVKQLVADWRKVGVDAQPALESSVNLQAVLQFHGYDALLYGVSIGVDPDVFAYWDSSQADIRSAHQLNFSEWKNTTADTSLESGRTRLDPTLRAVKYQGFLSAWQSDAPALGLYQPRYLYVTSQPVYNLKEQLFNGDTDRYNNVNQWMIREARVTD